MSIVAMTINAVGHFISIENGKLIVKTVGIIIHYNNYIYINM